MPQCPSLMLSSCILLLLTSLGLEHINIYTIVVVQQNWGVNPLVPKFMGM